MAGPDRPGDPWDGSGLMASLALVIPIGCILALAGAAIAALTFPKLGGENSWKVKVKVASFASTFVGGSSAPVIGIAAALLAAVAIGHLAHGGPAVGTAVCVAAGWLVVVTVLSTVVDLTALSDTKDGTGLIIGQLVSDLGAVAVAAVTAVLGERSLRT